MSALARVLEPEAMDTAEEAASYDAMDNRANNAAFVERLFALGARGRMLDLGTGPAHIPLLVCARDGAAHVTALDLAHHMLRVARRNVEAAGMAARVELVHGDAKDLGLPDGAFDVVYSNTILHHIPDPRPFLREAARVLRPGGVLLIRDLFRPVDAARLEALVREHAAECTPDQRALFAASLHAAFTPEELRALCDECGLGAAEVVVDTDRHASIQVAARA